MVVDSATVLLSCEADSSDRLCPDEAAEVGYVYVCCASV